MGACWLLAAAFAAVVFAAPPAAPTNLTVDQLDQLLKQIRGQSDAKTARQITGIKLTERASAERIARWEAELAGDRSREALMVVTDVSAFLAPSAAEMTTMPMPDAQTQKRILARCRDYVNQTVPRLPNYFALRTTTSFIFTTALALESQPIVDSVFQKKQGPKVRYQALGPAKSSDAPEDQYFLLGSYADEVTYRGGTEFVNGTQGTNVPRSSLVTMSTSGDFGSVLEVIVVDFQEDQIAWDHWEMGHSAPGSIGPLAVFRYAVPSERSHFAVTYPNEQPDFQAYHGEVAIDPESGAVRWITLLASGSESGYFSESSQVVEFAPTEIAGVTYICPVHSVAIIRYFEAFEYENTAHTPIPSQISINDVAFTKHHLFRSESHILSGASAP
ncbi:MAG: hypothetical protein WAL45_13405 [Terracidiphilus sp.]